MKRKKTKEPPPPVSYSVLLGSMQHSLKSTRYDKLRVPVMLQKTFHVRPFSGFSPLPGYTWGGTIVEFGQQSDESVSRAPELDFSQQLNVVYTC